MNVRSNYNGQKTMIDKSKLIPGVSRVRCTKGYSGVFKTPATGWIGTWMAKDTGLSGAPNRIVWDSHQDLTVHQAACDDGRLELIEEQPTTMEELKITKEKVLEAASKCSTAAATLKTLFPEVFEKKDEPYRFEDDHQLPCGLHGPLVIMSSGDY